MPARKSDVTTHRSAYQGNDGNQVQFKGYKSPDCGLGKRRGRADGNINDGDDHDEAHQLCKPVHRLPCFLDQKNSYSNSRRNNGTRDHINAQ
ncbi:hypothetical protein D3C87_1485120 [compost metagenome]